MYVIGIVGRAYFNKDNQSIIQTHDAVRRMLMKHDDLVSITLLPTEDINYVDNEVGTDFVNHDKLDYMLSKCDGFIVPGGTYAYQFDEYVIKYAIAHDKPLLAICLGFQALCSTFASNRTKFDMTSHLDNDNHYGKSNQYIHEVEIKENTILSKIINNREIMVNSVHHDVVDFDMNGLVINAQAKDGVIEGVEYPNKKFIMGVQWHPEYINDTNTELIINEFINNL